MARNKPTRNFTFSEPIKDVETLKTMLDQLSYGTDLYHRTHRNADGTPMRWRKSGAVKTWKTDQNRFRMPVKHGLNNHDAIESLADFNLLLAFSYTEV